MRSTSHLLVSSLDQTTACLASLCLSFLSVCLCWFPHAAPSAVCVCCLTLLSRLSVCPSIQVCLPVESIITCWSVLNTYHLSVQYIRACHSSHIIVCVFLSLFPRLSALMMSWHCCALSSYPICMMSWPSSTEKRLYNTPQYNIYVQSIISDRHRSFMLLRLLVEENHPVRTARLVLYSGRYLHNFTIRSDTSQGGGGRSRVTRRQGMQPATQRTARRTRLAAWWSPPPPRTLQLLPSVVGSVRQNAKKRTRKELTYIYCVRTCVD